MQVSASRTLRVAVAALLTVALAGCGSGKSSPPAVAKVNSAAPASTAPVRAAASTKVTKAEVTLRPKGGSAPTGTATFVQPADKVEYHVDVSGAAAGPHALYLMQSATCDAAGNRTGPLSLLDASADGHGTADGTMLAELGTLVGRSLALYAGDKGDSDIVACGPITAAQ